MKRLALTLILLASPAGATPEYILPTLFHVTDVASDDVLNIRETPSPGAPIIGTLPPDARDIEVVAEQDGWGRVNVTERTGWVSMRFLASQTETWQTGLLPENFTCFGTEPFWSLDAQGDELVLKQPDENYPEGVSHPITRVASTGLFRDPLRVICAEGVTLFATPQICSDGMSDNLYGLGAAALFDADGRLLTGCCSIQP